MIPIGYRCVTSDALSSSTKPLSCEIAVPGSYRAAILQMYPRAPTTVEIHQQVPLWFTGEENYSLSPRMLETHPLLNASFLGTFDALFRQRRNPDGVELA